MAKLNAEELNRAHKVLKADARQRVIERGLLQFRADPETVEAVLQAADEQKVPVGALLRQWVQERLMLNTAQQKAPDLVQRVTILEEAVADLKRKLK
ncbi:MAG TPA: hypothetical protein V6D08_20340 [Candidatus Obscuribacterales bacterium]